MISIQQARKLRASIEQLSALLEDDAATEVPELFPIWKENQSYKVDDRVRYDEILYRCIQAHTSEAQFTPDMIPALWTRTGANPFVIEEWIQPTMTENAYSYGDHVMHNGEEWINTHPGEHTNVWEPGAYGWEKVAE